MPDREKVIKGLEIHTNMYATCKDCPYWDGVGSTCHNLWIDALKVLKAMQPTIGGWISVKEKLPEKPGRYLAASDSPAGFPKLIRILMFVKDLHKTDPCKFRGKHRSGWVEWDDEYGYYEYDAVTHWTPLPEPPEGEESE